MSNAGADGRELDRHPSARTSCWSSPGRASPPNQSGSVRIAHTCGYGGLSGKAVSVEPATGFTFDTRHAAPAALSGAEDDEERFTKTVGRAWCSASRSSWRRPRAPTSGTRAPTPTTASRPTTRSSTAPSRSTTWRAAGPGAGRGLVPGADPPVLVLPVRGRRARRATWTSSPATCSASTHRRHRAADAPSRTAGGILSLELAGAARPVDTLRPRPGRGLRDRLHRADRYRARFYDTTYTDPALQQLGHPVDRAAHPERDRPRPAS